ncbi:MAG: hypothetical protein JWN07_1548 [Hyphomicrobiales bacterium]|nr:hypothetical protein [Hyphomicrobiales bacterium]
MSVADGSLTKAPRWPAIDAARGVALVAMFTFHLGWDLTAFGLAPQTLVTDPRFMGYGHVIAVSFIGLAGLGLTLAARRGIDWPRALRRIGKIALAAAGVTVATWFAFPDAYIFFGILHLIAVAGLLSLPLLRAPTWLVAVIAVAALALPLVDAPAIFNSDALLWLGLGSKIPLTNDWRPLLPWFGVMLIGVLAGRAVLARGLPAAVDAWRPRGVAGRALVLGGQHSLLLYLVHQPIFLALVFIASTIVQPPFAASIDTFRLECEKQCMTSGGLAGLCTRACGCIATDAQAKGIGGAVAQNRLSTEQRKTFDDITKACIRRDPPAP